MQVPYDFHRFLLHQLACRCITCYSKFAQERVMLPMWPFFILETSFSLSQMVCNFQREFWKSDHKTLGAQKNPNKFNRLLIFSVLDSFCVSDCIVYTNRTQLWRVSSASYGIIYQDQHHFLVMLVISCCSDREKLKNHINDKHSNYEFRIGCLCNKCEYK